MKTTLLVIALSVFVLMAYAGRVADSAGTASVALTAQAPDAAIDPPNDASVEGRYLVPNLPSSVVDRLPAAEAQGDQYLPQRIELAELVVGERIPAAEDLATFYARDLPGLPRCWSPTGSARTRTAPGTTILSPRGCASR